MPEQSEIFVETWDKKKIIVGVLLLCLLIGGVYGAKQYLLPFVTGPASPQAQEVKGITTTNPSQTTQSSNAFTLPNAQDVANKMQAIQQQVTHLNVAEVASASPQMQQIIQQLQALPQQPAAIAKQACINICNKL